MGLGTIGRKTRVISVILMAAAIGFSLGSFRAAHNHTAASQLEDATNANVIVELLEDSVNRGFGESALVKGRVGSCDETICTAIFDSETPLLCGQLVKGCATYSSVDYLTDFYAWQEGSCGKLSVKNCEFQHLSEPMNTLTSLRSRILDLIGADNEQQALLQALICGYRRNINHTSLYALFQSCGLAHLVAVSGAHLVIVTSLFATLFKYLRVQRRFTIGVLVAIMAAYYVIAGMPVSALRATIMSALGLVSFFGKRRSSSLNALGISILIMVTISPETSISVSFTLSTLSTMGIVLFASMFRAWFKQTPLSHISFVLDTLSLTAGSSILSQLYACSMFNQLPLIAPLANVVCAPLLPLVCGMGLIASLGAVLFPATTQVVLYVPLLGSHLLTNMVSVLGCIPFASIPFSIEFMPAMFLSGSLAILLWVWWPRYLKKVSVVCCGVALAIAVLLAITADWADSISMLDIGQGDSILVRSRGASLLIDTGNQDSKLLEQLATKRVVHLDSVLITHADNDHCGSLDALQKAVRVDRIILAKGMTACSNNAAMLLVEDAQKTARQIVEISKGESFAVGAFTAHVVWPQDIIDGGNADSLCILLEYDGNDDGKVDYSALMTGDAEKDELEQIIEDGYVGDVDILKVGHHGSRNGSTLDEIQALHPEIALISCGKNNRYGHPSQDALSQLDNIGATIFRTDQKGQITCVFSSEGIAVK